LVAHIDSHSLAVPRTIAIGIFDPPFPRYGEISGDGRGTDPRFLYDVKIAGFPTTVVITAIGDQKIGEPVELKCCQVLPIRV
jgi:hypothetical protein